MRGLSRVPHSLAQLCARRERPKPHCEVPQRAFPIYPVAPGPSLGHRPVPPTHGASPSGTISHAAYLKVTAGRHVPDLWGSAWELGHYRTHAVDLVMPMRSNKKRRRLARRCKQPCNPHRRHDSAKSDTPVLLLEDEARTTGGTRTKRGNDRSGSESRIFGKPSCRRNRRRKHRQAICAPGATEVTVRPNAAQAIETEAEFWARETVAPTSAATEATETRAPSLGRPHDGSDDFEREWLQ
jgi:hypothetical protein